MSSYIWWMDCWEADQIIPGDHIIPNPPPSLPDEQEIFSDAKSRKLCSSNKKNLAQNLRSLDSHVCNQHRRWFSVRFVQTLRKSVWYNTRTVVCDCIEAARSSALCTCLDRIDTRFVIDLTRHCSNRLHTDDDDAATKQLPSAEQFGKQVGCCWRPMMLRTQLPLLNCSLLVSLCFRSFARLLLLGEANFRSYYHVECKVLRWYYTWMNL